MTKIEFARLERHTRRGPVVRRGRGRSAGALPRRRGGDQGLPDPLRPDSDRSGAGHRRRDRRAGARRRRTWSRSRTGRPRRFRTPRSVSASCAGSRAWSVSGTEGVAKPDPAIFVLACERFGLDPQRTVFVDDSPPNVAAAATAGLTAIHFQDAGLLAGRVGRARSAGAARAGDRSRSITWPSPPTGRPGDPYPWSTRESPTTPRATCTAPSRGSSPGSAAATTPICRTRSSGPGARSHRARGPRRRRGSRFGSAVPAPLRTLEPRPGASRAPPGRRGGPQPVICRPVTSSALWAACRRRYDGSPVLISSFEESSVCLARALLLPEDQIRSSGGHGWKSAFTMGP